MSCFLVAASLVCLDRSDGGDGEIIRWQILDDLNWPEEWPFRDSDFQRYDESDDADFYSSPRFVTHIDDPAIG